MRKSLALLAGVKVLQPLFLQAAFLLGHWSRPTPLSRLARRNNGLERRPAPLISASLEEFPLLRVAQREIWSYTPGMKLVALSALFSMLTFGLASCEPEREQARPKDTKMKKEATDTKGSPEGFETITLGGGCFWCVEAVYQQLDGIHSAVSGYMGGFVPNPTYRQVCEKNTGHVEVVQLVFDPKKITGDDILDWFWDLHDPTTLNRQGADVGPQYASVIFYHTDAQKAAAEKSMKAATEIFEDPIVTLIKKAPVFYKADDDHQDFYFLNGAGNRYCDLVIVPKLKKLKLKTIK